MRFFWFFSAPIMLRGKNLSDIRSLYLESGVFFLSQGFFFSKSQFIFFKPLLDSGGRQCFLEDKKNRFYLSKWFWLSAKIIYENLQSGFFFLSYEWIIFFYSTNLLFIIIIIIISINYLFLTQITNSTNVAKKHSERGNLILSVHVHVLK